MMTVNRAELKTTAELHQSPVPTSYYTLMFALSGSLEAEFITLSMFLDYSINS